VKTKMARDSARPASRRDTVRDFVWRFKVVGDAEPTHTLFDGGKFALPPGQEGRFWEAYGYDLQAGTPLYVTERRPPTTFKLFFDVDLPADTDDARCRECCAAISAAVDECFQRPRGCIVCAVLDGAGARRGGGLHLFFDAAVTGEQALAALRRARARCEAQLPWANWTKALDPGPLSPGGGLRMVGSDKCQACAHCRGGASARNCLACGGRGAVPLGKVYWPWLVLPEGPEAARRLRQLRGNPTHAARACSIRTELRPATDFLEPAAALVAPPRHSQRLELGASASEELQHAVQGYRPEYAQLRVSHVVRTEGRPPIVTVSGCGSKFCGNKGAAHGSNNIYFTVGAEGLAQRCRSSKHYGGAACDEYVGPRRPLSRELLEFLDVRPQRRRRLGDRD